MKAGDEVLRFYVGLGEKNLKGLSNRAGSKDMLLPLISRKFRSAPGARPADLIGLESTKHFKTKHLKWLEGRETLKVIFLLGKLGE